MTAREDLAFRQLAEKCNNALAENATLVIEVNDLRNQMKTLYQENADLRFELSKALGIDLTKTESEASTPLKCQIILDEKLEKQDKKERKIPTAKVPKSVKTNRIKKENGK